MNPKITITETVTKSRIHQLRAMLRWAKKREDWELVRELEAAIARFVAQREGLKDEMKRNSKIALAQMS